MKLAPNEYVIAAWAEPANGPGWANAPIVVVVGMRGTGVARLEYIQPGEQTAEMHMLYAVSATVAGQMRKAVEMMLRGDGGGA